MVNSATGSHQQAARLAAPLHALSVLWCLILYAEERGSDEGVLTHFTELLQSEQNLAKVYMDASYS